MTWQSITNGTKSVGAGVYLRKVSTTRTQKEQRWPTFQKKSTEVGVKNGKQQITRITCHCLFSLKKCQSVCFSGVLLFPVVCAVSLPPAPLPPLPCWLQGEIKAELLEEREYFRWAERLRFTPPVWHRTGSNPSQLPDLRRAPESPATPARATCQSPKLFYSYPTRAHVWQKEIFLIRDKNKCIWSAEIGNMARISEARLKPGWKGNLQGCRTSGASQEHENL